MAKWAAGFDGLYSRREKHMKGIVYLDGQTWVSRVWVNGDEVDRGEWDGRDIAIRNANGAMKRAVALRRYESECPAFAGDCENDDEQDDD